MRFSAIRRLLPSFHYYKLFPFKQFEGTFQRRIFFRHLTWLSKSFIAYSLFARYGLAKATTVGAKDLHGLTDVETEKLPKRLQRFRDFASIEYNGEAFMSPQDFLDSLIMDEPKERIFRRVINKKQLDKIIKNTPSLRNASTRMFRDLGENGIISYAEYLFLLTLLTKSQYSFSIAFVMFDEDDNGQIDKNEFLKIRNIIAFGADDSELEPKVQTKNWDYVEDRNLEELMSHRASLIKYKNAIDINSNPSRNALKALNPSSDMDLELLKKEESKLLKASVSNLKTDNTTIIAHLFGQSGKTSLSFDQFQIFYNNLQRELIEIEFHEFARGTSQISAMDFARLVLRYSNLHKTDHSPYIQRIHQRTEVDDEGITLSQFEQFSMFLNNLEDFSKAVRLYTAADIPVSRNEFVRAVKCSTGLELDPHLVDVLYKIFDANNDNKLSYSEFIEIMNDRLHRGMKNYSGRYSNFGWMPFKNCVIHELSSF